jgi:hypothetical protein
VKSLELALLLVQRLQELLLAGDLIGENKLDFVIAIFDERQTQFFAIVLSRDEVED